MDRFDLPFDLRDRTLTDGFAPAFTAGMCPPYG